MTGWRDFAVERNRETETWLIATSLKEKKEMNVRKTKNYIVIHLFGYPPLGDNDKELSGLLERTELRGYYVSANDTTDTAGGWMRPHRGGSLMDICFYYSGGKEEEQPKSGALWRSDAYDVILGYGFPVLRYGDELIGVSDE